MARVGRSTGAVLAVLAAVLVVVVGTTAATGWQRHGGDASASDVPRSARSDGASVRDAAAAGSTQGSTTGLPTPPAAARDPDVAARPGVLMARGSDLTVEQVDLGAATTVDVSGVSQAVTFVYRVTVSAGPYVMRDMPAVLSVGAVPVGVAAESEDLGTLVLYTYDDLVARPGGTISLTYGLPPGVAPDWSTSIEAAA